MTEPRPEGSARRPQGPGAQDGEAEHVLRLGFRGRGASGNWARKEHHEDRRGRDLGSEAISLSLTGSNERGGSELQIAVKTVMNSPRRPHVLKL